MHFRSTFAALSCLSFANSALARTAHVYFTEPRTTQSIEVLEPSDARLVLAQRLGVSGFHDLQEPTQSSIDAINKYGGQVNALFGQRRRSREQAIYLIDGVEQGNELISSKHLSSLTRFDIAQAPSYKLTKALLDDLQDQQEQITPESSFELASMQAGAIEHDDTQRMLDLPGGWTDMGMAGLQHVQKGTHHLNTTAIEAMLDRYIAHATRTDLDLILILVEPENKSLFKKSAAESWGEYRVAARKAQELPEDERPTRPAIEDITSGDLTAEELMEELEAESKTYPLSPSASRPQAIAAKPSNATAPKGILPSCYTSKSACQKTTNDCSGHGECVAKYQGKDQDNCFTCKCKAEKKDGLTTQWSGPACQKKDIASAFWLLASTTIVLCGMLAYGLGLLYSIGNEDLPSVLSSGVPALVPKH